MARPDMMGMVCSHPLTWGCGRREVRCRQFQRFRNQAPQVRCVGGAASQAHRPRCGQTGVSPVSLMSLHPAVAMHASSLLRQRAAPQRPSIWAAGSLPLFHVWRSAHVPSRVTSSPHASCVARSQLYICKRASARVTRSCRHILGVWSDVRRRVAAAVTDGR